MVLGSGRSLDLVHEIASPQLPHAENSYSENIYMLQDDVHWVQTLKGGWPLIVSKNQEGSKPAGFA
jgi:hypothetical protein